ncbi:hypothetical protein [Ottowia thiooxydans]|uniref:hypothetical protein n=1 Tax=Ottowia thiooxydans TaxID=219182 RepID=UPI0003FC906A|nr:hypothetical protein [Ottowia thiooxydans]
MPLHDLTFDLLPSRFAGVSTGGTKPSTRGAVTSLATVSDKNMGPRQDGVQPDWSAWCRSLLGCSARPLEIIESVGEHEVAASVQPAAIPVESNAAESAVQNSHEIEQQILNEGKQLIALLRVLKDDPELRAHLENGFLKAGIKDGIGHFQKSGSLATTNASSEVNTLSWGDWSAGLQVTVGKTLDSTIKAGAIATATAVAGYLASYTFGGLATMGLTAVGVGCVLKEGFTAITQLPQALNKEGFKIHVDQRMSELTRLVNSKMLLKMQEEKREPVLDLAKVVECENKLGQTQLTAEKDKITAEMNVRGPGVPFVPFTAVKTGSGGLSKKILSGALEAKAAFQSLFAPLVRGLSTLSGFLTDLPNIVRRAYARREADKLEQAQMLVYRQTIQDLVSRSGIEVSNGDITQAALRANHFNPGSNTTFDGTAYQARLGASLADLVRSSSEPVLIDVQVGSHHSMPVNLTLARALSWHLSIEAAKSSQTLSEKSDDPMTVADPDGKLYGFLMSVPGVYSGSMVGVGNEQAPLGSQMIDDHRAGFPHGARSMQFEQEFELKLDEHGQPLRDQEGKLQLGAPRLRIRFLKEPVAHIHASLGNASKTWGSLLMAMGNTGLDTGKPSAVDYSNTSTSELAQRLKETKDQLTMKDALLKLNERQIEILGGWKQLNFEPGSVSAS